MRSLISVTILLTFWSATHHVTQGIPFQPHHRDLDLETASENRSLGEVVGQGSSSRLLQQAVPQVASASPGSHSERFGSQQFGTQERRVKRSTSDDSHRALYMTTRFSPVVSLFDLSGIVDTPRTQLWSPVSNFQRYDSVQARSISQNLQDTPDLLGSGPLVSIDERVIDIIERYPVDCTQRVLCRIGRNMVEASPLQALFLYNFEGNVFGYRDEESQRAIRAALDGDDCDSLFEGCKDSFV